MIQNFCIFVLEKIYVTMVEFTVTILGCGSAKPTLRHHTSSQIVSRFDKLLLGHFSSRYKTEDCFLECATRYFPDVLLADEGVTVKILTTPTTLPEGA